MEPKNTKKKIFWTFVVILVLSGIITASYFIYKKQITATQNVSATFSPKLNNSASPSGFSSKNDPNGPYFHQIFSAKSTDGIIFQKQGSLLFDHASVPGAVIKGNKIYLYFVDASGDEDQMSVAISDDLGKTFTKNKVKIDNAPFGAVDPHPELVSGKIRLYYFLMTPAEKEQNNSFKIYSAESNDGINFENPKLAYENPELITDPDVFQTDTDWRMFLSEGKNLILTISTDQGLTFKKDTNFSWNQGGVCDTFKIGGVYRTFYCGEGGIRSATGAETGKLTPEPDVRLPADNNTIACDPSVVQLPDSSYLMFYKTQTMKK